MPGRGTLLRSADFRRLWAGDTVSQLGSAVGVLAVPYVATTELNASSFQMGVLAALGTAGFLVAALPAGALVDRWGKRRVMIAADLSRAGLLLALAVGAAAHLLTVAAVLVVATLIGLGTVFFDVAYQSYLPLLVADDQVVEGNAKLQASESVSQAAGPALGGLLLSRVGATWVLGINGLGYLGSAVFLGRIRHAERRTPVRGPLVREIREGLTFVLGHPLLRRLLACTGLANLAGSGVQGLLVVYEVRTLHFSALTIGLVDSAAAVGGLLGSFVATPLARRLGQGRSILLTAAAFQIGALVFPLASVWPAVPTLIAGGVLFSAAVVAYNIATVSFRQRLCPPEMLGRMNATARFLVWGTIPIGALIGGALARGLGVPTTVWVLSVAGFVCLVPIASRSILDWHGAQDHSGDRVLTGPPAAAGERMNGMHPEDHHPAGLAAAPGLDAPAADAPAADTPDVDTARPGAGEADADADAAALDAAAPDAGALDPGNPFAAPSALPFALPPFADITPDHFAPAFRAGMAAQLAEVAAVVADPAAPTLANTLVPLERSGQLLGRAAATFHNLLSSLGTPELEAIERDWAPAMTAHADAIRLDPDLFRRIDALHAAGPDGLDPQDRYLVERYHTDYVLAGAGLDEAGRDRLRELNQRISALEVTFGQRVQAAMDAAALLVDDAAGLAGLTEEQIGAAATAARARGVTGWVIPLVLPSQQPALEVLTDRGVRERLYRASVERAGAGEFDTGPVAVELALTRAERARLLGFATHADVQVADETARTTAAVDDLLGPLVAPAVANLAREREVLAEAARRDGVELAAWDWQFYSERVRAERYSVDTAALRPYFELERVLTDGVFWAAGRLYGVTFRRREDLVGYHPDVRVYEIEDAAGTGIGLFLADFHARAGKRGGAWMSTFVDQSDLLGLRPVIVNNLNVPRPADGAPTLLTFDEVVTLFHEFGHSLHGMFSAVRYPRCSGTNVPRDFVEFPSQVNEMWMLWPEVLAHYAVHVDTGEPLAADTVAAIEAAELWGQGQATFEYLAATLLDQAWHRIGPDEVISSARDFEARALAAAGLASDLVPPRYRSNYFRHIFTGGYSAGYYAYIFSEVLDADLVEWFRENGGLTEENGAVFRDRLLAVGGSQDPLAAFRAVRGRPADIGPLLRRRGLAGPAVAAGSK